MMNVSDAAVARTAAVPGAETGRCSLSAESGGEGRSPRSRLGRGRLLVGMVIDPQAKPGSVDRRTHRLAGEQARPDINSLHPTAVRAVAERRRSAPTLMQQPGSRKPHQPRMQQNHWMQALII